MHNWGLTTRKGIVLFLGISLFLAFLFFMRDTTKQQAKNPSEPENTITIGEIYPGDSLHARLAAEGIEIGIAQKIGDALKDVFDPRHCQAGDRYELVTSQDGTFKTLRYYQKIHIYEVDRDALDRFTAITRKIPVEKKIVCIEGDVDSTLWESMQQMNIRPETILKFADIYAWQIDFLTETHQGDSFKIVLEQSVNEERGFLGDETILASRYQGRETDVLRAIRFKGRYYDPDGKSLQKYFLRAPLTYRRISSRFSHNRFHPILRYWRPHLGIDYAAPTGTPVVSVADGVVSYKGWKNGYGRYIRIRHNRRYKTTYGHLSRYAKGLRSGAKVKQGQVIGYVGSTGLATGPHLDFRMTDNGRFVNFLKIVNPPGLRIPKQSRADFERIARERIAQLESTGTPSPGNSLIAAEGR